MFLEDAAAERINLAKGHGLETARSLKTKAEAAYAAEKVEDAEHHADLASRAAAGGTT
jgi:hypothetical protein